MRKQLYIFVLIAITLTYCTKKPAQELTAMQVATIEKEIAGLFEESIEAGENLDVDKVAKAVNDSLLAGFINNGHYFKTYEKLLSGYKQGIRGIVSQQIKVVHKKITVLSENAAILTATGNYTAYLEDGRTLEGTFFWSFVYAKMNNEWKVVHSHMSNQK